VTEVEAFVDGRLAEGADYIKVLIEDGRVLGFDVPALTEDLVREPVLVAHDRGVKVVAHAFTRAAAATAVRAGVDRLTHVFLDQPHTDEFVQ
jgi:imidazolonepropionase-like amidohydrolase